LTFNEMVDAAKVTKLQQSRVAHPPKGAPKVGALAITIYPVGPKPCGPS
jgi:hypothetical protein